MSYKVDWIDVNPYIRFEAINEINEYLVGHFTFDKMKYQIWDFIETKELHIDDDDLAVITSLDKSSFVWNKKMKIAE